MQHDVVKLINLIEKRPCIYDQTSSKDVLNKIKIDQQWAEVAAEMDYTVFDCKSKWANLRSAYCRYLREGENTPQGRPRKKWYMAKPLEFLREHIVIQTAPTTRSKKSWTRAKGKFLTETSMAFDTDSNTRSDLVTPIDSQQKVALHEIKTEDSMDIPSAYDVIQLSDEEDKYSNHNSSVGCIAMNKLGLEVGRTIQVQPPYVPPQSINYQPTSEEDPHTMFFKSILVDYKGLTQKRKRHFRELMVTTMNKLQEEDENDQKRQCACECKNHCISK